MKKLKEILIHIFVEILLIIPILIVFIAFSILYIGEQTNISLYNNGIHEEDGGEWELVSINVPDIFIHLLFINAAVVNYE